MEEIKPVYSRFRALLKLSLISIYLVVAVFAFLLFRSRHQLSLEQSSKKRELLGSFPYAKSNVIGYGTVKEPLVQFDLKYPSGYQKTTFLLDSGALLSSLPFEAAQAMGVNLSLLPRQTFRGFGNSMSYAYRGSVEVRFKEGKVVELPVVFTENSGTKHLLGRYGFFDNYSVEFNHIKQSVDIYQ
jgi:hypothetical protein